ncbi:kinesin-like protein Klp10A [Haematobia irritans]|uniref:kinesin-like protein Klp10A n=1 Tax=Haematobia irritans TaxID=7368 RepID=UPI003F4F978C
MEFIKIGQSVNIKRSDGRIHPAVVSKTNASRKSLTVEWLENDDTRAKEIELNVILALNPDLVSSKSKVVNRPSMNLFDKAKQDEKDFRPRRNTITATSLTSPKHQTQPQLTNCVLRPRTTSDSSRFTSNRASMPKSATSPVKVRNSMTAAMEVQRIKENREKRRTKQAELRQEKQALMNKDPGNPNWETAQMIRAYRSTLKFDPLKDDQIVENYQITVCVRKRPLSRKEINNKEIDVISVPCKDTLIVHEPRTKVDLTKFLENHKFRFDYVFDDCCDNAMVYKYTAKPLVQTIFEGGMATCFAYGQTGSGKTHTMGGEFNGKIQDCKNGIYAMAAKDVFEYLNGSSYRHLNLVVSASFFEIYGGKVFDLLSNKEKLSVLEDGKQQIQIVGLTEKVVENVEDVLKLIQQGNNTRTSGQTSANANSSRSHAVFQIVLRPPGCIRVHGKFSFVDLAGNERGADTSSADRQTRMEGAEINKSLLALKECIRALGKQTTHLPFRVSKLTQVLRDSFIGEKSKTCMIAMISPSFSSCEHTLNTLRYADRVKELVVKDIPDTMREGIAAQTSNGKDEKDHNISPHEHISMRDNSNTNGPTSSSNNFEILRSLNENDVSDEVFDQNVAISDLQQFEEMVVDQHRAFNDFLLKFLPESMRLYSLTNYVDYDQDFYCKHGEAYFTQLAEIATTCKDLMVDFRKKLAKEEMISGTVQSGNKH